MEICSFEPLSLGKYAFFTLYI